MTLKEASFGQTSVTTGGELEQGGGLAYGDVIVNSSNKTDIILAGVSIIPKGIVDLIKALKANKDRGMSEFTLLLLHSIFSEISLILTLILSI